MTQVDILLGTPDASLTADLTRLLTGSGYAVAASAASAEEMQRVTEQLRPDLAVIDSRLPAACWLGQGHGLPVVLLLPAGAALESALAGAVSAVVFLPPEAAPLQAAVELALARHRAEERLRLAEKMEAVGRMAGGVAHDFNNLLTLITGYSDLLSSQVEAAHPWRPMLEEIRQAGERAADLTRQLLTLSRLQLVQPRVLDLNHLVSGLAPVLRGLLGTRVEWAAELGPGVPAVRADPSQIEQVLLQLAANARAAMPAGGALTVQTAGVDLSEAEARTRPGLRAGRHARLCLHDTGCGMPEAVRTRAFEPFFTTKEGGQRDGLGLAAVYGIVRQSGGQVEVASSPGQGSTFTIYLPAAEALPALTLPGLPRGAETVLLVEDEPMVRELNRQILHMCGYTVLEACDGSEALRVSGAHAGAMELLVTDVLMPRLGGPELAQVLTGQRPGLRVLFLSGCVGAEGEGLALGSAPAGAGFLAKPYAPLELARKVRAVLDAGGAAAGPVSP